VHFDVLNTVADADSIVNFVGDDFSTLSIDEDITILIVPENEATMTPNISVSPTSTNHPMRTLPDRAVTSCSCCRSRAEDRRRLAAFSGHRPLKMSPETREFCFQRNPLIKQICRDSREDETAMNMSCGLGGSKNQIHEIPPRKHEYHSISLRLRREQKFSDEKTKTRRRRRNKTNNWN
jgi:hypothetical protein